ncbi:MAG: nuclear transport factor 2 family protein [Chloroflexia bacterium]|nr:nuclear transport factor 2 family protein [Chloroflexia bacterium]
MKNKHLLVFFALIISIGSCTEEKPQMNSEDELKKVAETIDYCIGWVKTKDLDSLFSIVANDSMYLSVHPSDRVVRGFDEFKGNSSFWMNPDFKYVKHEIKDLTINLSKSGEVAWFYCRLNDLNTWKGEPANWENARWTGVLEKRNGQWKIVQQHFSFASE